MGNVYFVNCFLACTLTFIVGYWSGKRTAERRLSVVLERMLAPLVKQKSPATNVDNNNSLH